MSAKGKTLLAIILNSKTVLTGRSSLNSTTRMRTAR